MQTEIILIASGKGGEGKTTFTANLGSALAKKGFKTCVIDLDLRLGKMDLLLGLESKVEFDISHVLSNKKTTSQALIKDKRVDNLFLLAAPRGHENTTLSSEALGKILDELKSANFDFVLIDCHSDTNKDNLLSIASKLSDRSIVITNPEKPSLRDADSIIALLESNKKHEENRVYLVINKYIEPRLISKKYLLKTDEIQRILAIPLLGSISYELKNSHAINKGIPVIYINSKAHNEYKAIRDKLVKITSPQIENNHKKKKKLF